MTPPTRRRLTLRDRLRKVDGPRAAPVAVLLGGACSALVGAFAGREGTTPAALTATVVVLVFFWTGALPVLLVGAQTSRAAIGFVILMMTYALRLVAVLLALAIAEASGAVDTRWLAVTLIVLTLVWTSVQAALVGRSRATL